MCRTTHSLQYMHTAKCVAQVSPLHRIQRQDWLSSRLGYAPGRPQLVQLNMPHARPSCLALHTSTSSSLRSDSTTSLCDNPAGAGVTSVTPCANCTRDVHFLPGGAKLLGPPCLPLPASPPHPSSFAGNVEDVWQAVSVRQPAHRLHRCHQVLLWTQGRPLALTQGVQHIFAFVDQ